MSAVAMLLMATCEILPRWHLTHSSALWRTHCYQNNGLDPFVGVEQPLSSLVGWCIKTGRVRSFDYATVKLMAKVAWKLITHLVSHCLMNMNIMIEERERLAVLELQY